MKYAILALVASVSSIKVNYEEIPAANIGLARPDGTVIGREIPL